MTTPATAGGLTVEATLHLVVERLEDLRKQQEKDTNALASSIESLRSEMQAQSQTYVPRAEWEQRNRLVDERHQSQGREIGQLRTELTADVTAVRTTVSEQEKSRRVPWPSIASVAISAGALLIVLLQLPLGQG